MQVSRISKRHGKFLAFTVLFSVVLMGFAALAVDIGVMSATRAQLKTVADAGALAGARQLVSDNRLSSTYSLTSSSPEIVAANSKATSIGQANIVFGQAAVIQTSDMAVGTKILPDPSDSTFTATINNATTNSVQLTAKRDSTHSGVVPSFFSRIWGSSGSTASVTSTATIEVFTIGGFTAGATNSSVLPIAMSQSSYNGMFTTPITDNYSYSPVGGTYGTVTSGSDGVPETSVFPVNNSDPGNWGTIDIGVSNNGTSTTKSQIANGITPAQLDSEFPPSGVVTSPHVYSANPGISAGIKSDLAAIIGKPIAVPLYSTTSGNGANATYTVVGYAAARIVAVSLTGNPKYVVIQPAFDTDPTATPGAATTVQKGGLVRLHLSR
jgi:Putative Flp pilus-assembly TadE/G-like